MKRAPSDEAIEYAQKFDQLTREQKAAVRRLTMIARSSTPTQHDEAPRAYWLRVEGDSMTAPGGKSYPAGCLIHLDLDRARSATIGDRVIAKVKGPEKVTFRQLVELSGRCALRALNPSWPTIDAGFEILGKVIGKWEGEAH